MTEYIEYNALVLEKPFSLSLKRLKIPKKLKIAKMIYSGVCGTDKHAIKGETDIKLPVVLGHENAAEVEGKRVTWPTIIPCGKCRNCRIGMENVCERNLLFGLTTTDPFAGGWGEYTPIPKDTILYDVPDSLDDDVAVLIETMASTKSLNQVDVKDKNILIIGSGPIGLLSAVHAKYKDASLIAIIGHKEQAMLIGKIIDEFYEKDTPEEELRNSYDIVMDAGGNPGSLEYSIRAAKPRSVILEGACMPKCFNFDISKLIKKELKLFTQLGYVPNDFIWATKMVEENQNILRKVITHKFKLNEYEKAIDTILNVHHGKIMFSLAEL